MITQDKWVWYGNAMHFICGYLCRFHLATKIGNYVVSTVGEYPGRHDNFEEIGFGRLYETMVFEIGKDHECGCPDIITEELDFEGCNTHEEANAIHMKMCLKWANKEKL